VIFFPHKELFKIFAPFSYHNRYTAQKEILKGTTHDDAKKSPKKKKLLRSNFSDMRKISE
jgi:hypothetical protein